jgi:type 1 glutamine amidotransferase
MRPILQRLAILIFFAVTTAAAQLDADSAQRVLFFTQSAGYVHDVVKRPTPDRLSFAEFELQSILGKGREVTCTQDGSMLTAATLKQYGTVVFYTTGELLAPPGAARALLDWVKNGGGFVGIHCATDTWYSVTDYGEMLGAVFESHPWNQAVAVKLERKNAVSVETAPSVFEIEDEIYQFRGFRPEPVSVLMTLAAAPGFLAAESQPDYRYPLAWCREYGNGRVFYLALGHRETAWKNGDFHWQLLNGIVWVSPQRAAWSMPPPTGAHVLLGERQPHAFAHRDGAPCRWTTSDHEITVKPGTGDIISTDKFPDFRMHLEFRVPNHRPEVKGQARGNSGVYLQDRYEIQILDSFWLEPKADDCGAIYGKKAPLTNACRKPWEWQSYDVGFKAARFDAAGKKIANARASIWQNGLKIHDDVEIDGPTGGGMAETPEPGPLRLQDHGNLVAFRNIWVVPR